VKAMSEFISPITKEGRKTGRGKPEAAGGREEASGGKGIGGEGKKGFRKLVGWARYTKT